jgi:anti-sigma-K factor RskA
MSGSEPTPGGDEPRDLDILAGEYVLGVLDADEMAAVLALARSDPALGAALSRWEARLAPLAASIRPTVPPPALWQRIEARIAPLPDEPANDALPTPSLRRTSARGWQAATVVALALAAGFAVVAFLPRPVQPPALMASIVPKGAPAPAFVAQVQRDGSVVLAAVTPETVPAGRDLELWVLPPGAQNVASLGVLPAAGRTLRLPSLPPAGTQLLVSLEPRGGSPTGQPTGPVLYSGTLVRL